MPRTPTACARAPRAPVRPTRPCALRARAPRAPMPSAVSRALSRLRPAQCRLRPAQCPAPQPYAQMGSTHFRFCIFFLFFFHSFFFLCYWKITHIYIFQYPKINLLKFILFLFFFSGLHTVKILENFFTSFFFSFSSSLLATSALHTTQRKF